MAAALWCPREAPTVALAFESSLRLARGCFAHEWNEHSPLPPVPASAGILDRAILPGDTSAPSSAFDSLFVDGNKACRRHVTRISRARVAESRGGAGAPESGAAAMESMCVVIPGLGARLTANGESNSTRQLVTSH